LVALVWFVSALLRGSVTRWTKLGQSAECQSNLTYAARGLRMYADDWDDTLPAATVWTRNVLPYVSDQRQLHCPAVIGPDQSSRYGYALSPDVAGKPRSAVSDTARTPMVYDSTDLKANASDPVTSLPQPGRHLARAPSGGPLDPADFGAAVDGHVDARMVP